jgi:hypothetical protein
MAASRSTGWRYRKLPRYRPWRDGEPRRHRARHRALRSDARRATPCRRGAQAADRFILANAVTETAPALPARQIKTSRGRGPSRNRRGGTPGARVPGRRDQRGVTPMAPAVACRQYRPYPAHRVSVWCPPRHGCRPDASPCLVRRCAHSVRRSNAAACRKRSFGYDTANRRSALRSSWTEPHLATDDFTLVEAVSFWS